LAHVLFFFVGSREMLRISLLSVGFLLAACAPQSDLSAQTSANSLPAFFDCVREHKKVLISAHRGGPNPDFPENAIETFAYNAKDNLILLEIDVQQSRDGVLFMYHDERLGRTATGSGKASAKTWNYLQEQRLKTPDGSTTGYSLPSFEAVLNWGKTANAILQVDIKPGTPYEDIISAIRQTDMQNKVMLITYTLEQAREVHRLAPNIMLSVGADSQQDLQALQDSGIPLELLIGWTGLGEPKQKQYQALNAVGMEAIAGTLGPVDKQLARSGDTRPYQFYVDAGASIIATDRTEVVRAALHADDDVLETCTLPN
jgi:glycerophosphoryl diester phosphodiesterase